MMASEWNQIIGTVKAIGVWDILDIVIGSGADLSGDQADP